MIKNLQQDVRMHQVVVEDILGQGGYGVVYKGAPAMSFSVSLYRTPRAWGIIVC